SGGRRRFRSTSYSPLGKGSSESAVFFQSLLSAATRRARVHGSRNSLRKIRPGSSLHHLLILKGKCMADSLLASLFGMLDSRSVDEIAGSLEAPQQSVLQGLKSSIASVLGGMASKSEDSDALRNALDLTPSSAEDTTLTQIARAASDPNSPLISGGRRLLS